MQGRYVAEQVGTRQEVAQTVERVESREGLVGQTREREEAGIGKGSFLDEKLWEKGTYVTGTWCGEDSWWEHQLVAVQ